MLGSLFSAATRIITTPIAAVVDVAEVTGLKSDSGKSHTSREIEGFFKDLENALQGSQERR